MAENQEEDLELSDFEDEDLDAAPEVVSSSVVDTLREGSNTSASESPTELAKQPVSTPTLHSATSAVSQPSVTPRQNLNTNENGDKARMPDGESASEIAIERRQREAAEAALEEERARADAVEKVLRSSQSRQNDLENALKRAGSQIAAEKEARQAAEAAQATLQSEKEAALKVKAEAETAKLESDTAFARMKATVQEAVRQRDEARRNFAEEKRQREAAQGLGEKARDELERRNVRAAMELSEMEAKVAEARGEAEKLRETFKQQDLKLLEFEGSVKRLSDELAAEKGRREDAEGKLAVAEAEMTSLHRNADEAKSLRERVTSAERQLDELKEKLYDSEQKLKEEEQAKMRVESELKTEKELRAREKAEVDARNVKLRSKFEELIKDKGTLKAALEEEREKAAKMGAEMSGLEQEIRKAKVESTEEIESLGKELTAKDAELARLEGALREATKGGGLQALLDEERVARAAAEKGQREAEGIVALERGQLAEAERGREEAQAGLAAAREESAGLRTKLESTEAEVASLREALEAAQSATASKQADCDALEGKLAEARQREAELRDEIQGLTSEVRAAKQEVTDWKGRHEGVTSENGELMEELDKNSREVARLNMLVSQWKRAAEEANAKISSKEEIAQAAIAARAAAESSLKMADERAAELRQRAEEMAQQLDDIESGLERRLRSQGLGLGFGQWRWDDCMPWASRRSRRRGGDEEGLGEGEHGHLMEPLI
ncbi:hypothetical protein KFL_004430050 [Klebsormidium nitens]|uniref:Uncharacterized protein n=1 Tax=Klebsormidium nitens TaxID=105231 RepID=A0A1Y1IHQ3_KLENI|nr:hypothetical protein KFL_004430050 [Klebsormidium nitens]|eukprot:GAQ88601.1 hypothetical protein KFL_004430050 [Klebsormidium nitens]